MLFVGQANNKLITPVKAAILIAVAILLLFFALVFGRHFGVDPVGWAAGRVLMGKGAPAEEMALPHNVSVIPPQTVAPSTGSESAKVRTEPQQIAAEQAGAIPEVRQENFTLTAHPKQKAEFKFNMERDYELDYHWATDGKPLYCELRGLKQGSKDGKDKVFGKLKETRGKGFFIAPFTGNFSLNWENKSDKPVVVRLGVKGIYKALN